MLGHELAHHTLAHLELATSIVIPFEEVTFLNSKTDELMADIVGAQFASMAGYDECAAYTFWTRVQSNEKPGRESDSHRILKTE